MSILTVTLHPAIDKVLKLKRLAPNDIARSTIEMLYCGGKGNNAARALVGLGEPTSATGFQGGHSGRFASENLATEGVKTAFVTCAAPTRTSLLIHEEDTGYTYAVYEPGQAVTEKEAAYLIHRFTQLLADHSICLFCGSGQSPILENIYAQCIQIAREKQVITLFRQLRESTNQRNYRKTRSAKSEHP